VTLYSEIGFEEEHFLDYCGRNQQKQWLLVKTTCDISLYVQLTARIHVTIQW